MKRYLSVCAIYRDEAEYLCEWIEFHRLVGVERFFLYNNSSRDSHREVLEPYVDEGTVTLHDWPAYSADTRIENQSRPELEAVQIAAYEHCLAEHAPESRWIAFIDTDEFLFSPTGRPASELLVDYESYPGVAVFWVVFGTSGHLEKPSGLVIENYLRRTGVARRNAMHKSIVDPQRVTRVVNEHYFLFPDGVLVDETRRPIEEAIGKDGFIDPETLPRSRLRINHYWTRSEAEWRKKLISRRGGTDQERGRIEERIARLGPTLNEEYDEAITIYAPPLQSAIATRQRATTDAPAGDGPL